MNKVIWFTTIGVFLLICFSITVNALTMDNLRTISNQYTQRPDWIRSTNFSGENITTDECYKLTDTEYICSDNANELSLHTEDDIVLYGKTWVEGVTDATLHINVITNALRSQVSFDHSGTAAGFIGTNLFTDQMVISPRDSVGRQLILVPFDYRTDNFDHPVQDNPTLYIHSITDPDVDNTEWMSFAYINASDRGEITVGKGEIVLMNDTIVEGTLDVGGDLIVQNGSGTDIFEVTKSGATQTVLDVPVLYRFNIGGVLKHILTSTYQQSLVDFIIVSGEKLGVGISGATPTHALNVYGAGVVANISGDSIFEGDLDVDGDLIVMNGSGTELFKFTKLSDAYPTLSRLETPSNLYFYIGNTQWMFSSSSVTTNQLLTIFNADTRHPDNSEFGLGTASDFIAEYNSTDTIFNPKNVGSGKIWIEGELVIEEDATFGDSVITKGMIIYNDVQNDPKGMLNITIASKPGSPGVARFGGIVMRNLNASSVGSPPFAIIPGWDGNYNTELLFFVNNTYEVKFGKFGITSVDGFLAADLGSFKSATRGALSYYMPWDGSIESEMMFSGATARPSRFAFKSYYYDTAWHGIGDIMRIEAYNTGQNVSLINASLYVTDGNITAENVYLPSFIFAHTDKNITSLGSGFWHNITFSDETASPKRRITHDNATYLNDTFIIVDNGYYNIDYYLSFADIAASPKGHIVARVLKNGAEIAGSLREQDTTKQNSDTLLGHGNILNYFETNDEITFQFATDDATIALSSHATYGEHKDTAIVTIERIG